MADNSFSKFVPGFDFLQGLMKGAGAAMPGVGQWVAPTLNPEELGKRIDELRTVQFWLEQNARMLGATIQALEVQKMTLATLKSMNVPLEQLSEALQVPAAATWPGLAPEVKAAEPPAPAPQSAPVPSDSDAKPPAVGAVDPLQWWGALSQQFTQLAANAMKDSTSDAAKHLAGSIVKQSLDVAGDTLRKAGAVPGAVAGQVAKSLAPKPAAKSPAAKRKL
ncbi:PhaM family polyhydroxyalkanoate granule multifunctional regulatory protein [Roseateles sp.]|uniref:PhaM family polyhydroxyalkanoate granule multifunctional regulatory protein n=1 Tax=Roseateles sp. TaxID=1971397 RepID=UPI00286BE2FB|nr:PhaM family polyhydroxyalkanoate granule multifunctional regulatory protein [Roseateles sp.]